MRIEMKTIDLNADIGEPDAPDWRAAELDVLTIVSSANIACGGHAGDAHSMRRTLRAAKDNGVSVGAHPSYPDKENFGRRSLMLGQDISVQELKRSLTKQVKALIKIAEDEAVSVNYIKPHGALYNDAVADKETADLIIDVLRDINPQLALLGGPNSEMMKAAKNAGVQFIAEGFIDRRYTDDGHLRSRKLSGAVLATDSERIEQAVSLATRGHVETDTGQRLAITAQSLCLHGDSAGVVASARKARHALEKADIKIRPFIQKETK